MGLKMYQELKTRKNKTEARTELTLNPEKILLEVSFESI
jgi:phage terminase large subunit-like protein